MILELRFHTLSRTPCQRPTAGFPCQKWTICSVPGGRSGAIFPALLPSVRLNFFLNYSAEKNRVQHVISARRIIRAEPLAVTRRIRAAAPLLFCCNPGRPTPRFVGRFAVNAPG